MPLAGSGRDRRRPNGDGPARGASLGAVLSVAGVFFFRGSVEGGRGTVEGAARGA